MNDFVGPDELSIKGHRNPEVSEKCYEGYDVQKCTNRRCDWYDKNQWLQRVEYVGQSMAGFCAKCHHRIGSNSNWIKQSGSKTKRSGQPIFRELLIQLYGGCCAMSGNGPIGNFVDEKSGLLIQAAHIIPYEVRKREALAKGRMEEYEDFTKEDFEHNPSNGLLLRSDLHQLFEHSYLTVDPDTLRIYIPVRYRALMLRQESWSNLHGKRLGPRIDGGYDEVKPFLRVHYRLSIDKEDDEDILNEGILFPKRMEYKNTKERKVQ